MFVFICTSLIDMHFSVYEWLIKSTNQPPLEKHDRLQREEIRPNYWPRNKKGSFQVKSKADYIAWETLYTHLLY